MREVENRVSVDPQPDLLDHLRPFDRLVGDELAELGSS